MGKYKSHLGHPDVTDPKDTFSPPEQEEPSAADWALWDLQRSVNSIVEAKHEITLGDLEEIYSAINTLKEVAKNTEKPF